jgi:flagellar biosynthesis protein FlhB
MAGEDDAEAEPTRRKPQRRGGSRRRGRKARSRSRARWRAFGALAGGTLGLMIALPPLGARCCAAARLLDARMDSHRAAADRGWLGDAGRAAGGGARRPRARVAATLLQTRGLVSAKGSSRGSTAQPDRRLKRLFGPRARSSSCARCSSSALSARRCGGRWATRRAAALFTCRPRCSRGRAEAALDLALAALVAFAGIAALDWLWVRYRHLTACA